MTAPQEPTQAAYMDVMPLAPDAPAEIAPDAAFDSSIAAKYDAVMAFCLTRGQVLFTTLMTEFVDIHLGDLERYAVLECNGYCSDNSLAVAIFAVLLTHQNACIHCTFCSDQDAFGMNAAAYRM